MNRIARIAAIVQGGALYYKYQATTTAAAEATTPKYTFGAGAPAAVVSWGDGTANTPVVSGVELNHAYAVPGTYTVTLIAAQQDVYLTQIEIPTDKISGAGWAAKIPALSNLKVLDLSDNNMSGAMTLAQLPASMTSLSLKGTSVTITGTLAQLPASMTILNLFWTLSVITGGAVPMVAKNISMQLFSMGMTQANVDSVINRLWLDKATFTAASPTLSIGGTNAAPSGIYQNAVPPTTGKERIFDLVTGTQTPAGPEWTISYTA